MVLNDMGRFFKPVLRNLSQDNTLEGDSGIHYYIEGRYPIAGHRHQILPGIINIPQFSPIKQIGIGDIRFENNILHSNLLFFFSILVYFPDH